MVPEHDRFEDADKEAEPVIFMVPVVLFSEAPASRLAWPLIETEPETPNSVPSSRSALPLIEIDPLVDRVFSEARTSIAAWLTLTADSFILMTSIDTCDALTGGLFSAIFSSNT